MERIALRPMLFAVAALVSVGSVGAQTTEDAERKRIADVLNRAEEIEKGSKTFRFGLSLGWRHLLVDTKSVYRDAVIDPITGNLQVDKIDRGDVMLSGTMTAFPWRAVDDDGKRTGNRWAPLGFLANVKLVSFSGDNLSAFNQSLEGGIGLSWRLAPDFAIGATIERAFSRRLRDWVKPGQPLEIDGERLTSISREDGRFFRDDNLSAASFKFV